MKKSDAPSEAAADNQDVAQPVEGSAAAATDPDRWAKAVVDGVPVEDEARSGPESSDADTPAEVPVDAPVDVDIQDPEAPTGVAPDLQAAADAAGPIPESWFVDGPDSPVGTDGTDTTADEEAATEISVEDLVIDLERVTTERDQYLDASRRLQAEFENYKKQVLKRETEARERANDSLIGELLPVLDAFDGAVANGAEDVAPMRTSFIDALAKQGLERIDPEDGPFDPNLHEAVMHEDAEDTDGPVVAEVMRAGYVWKGRVLRPAMVRTRG